MKTPSFAPGVLVLALALLPSPVQAQYLYLDSNGDGVHTSADVLHGVGPTVIDVYLDTAHNRDGSAAVCDEGPGSTTPLGMFAYELTFKASGGTVSASPFTNRLPQFSILYPPLQPGDGVHVHSAPYFSQPGLTLPPGKYLLGTITMNVAGGAPSVGLDSVFTLPGSAFQIYSGFGSPCGGTIYPDFLMYKIDWFDVDGLAYSAGGMANAPPVLQSFPDPIVVSGETSTVPLSATDADGEPLTFAKASGPAFLTVETTDPGSGTAHGEIRLAPFASDVGTASGSVSATDGTVTNTKAFTITVTVSPGHAPVLYSTPGLTTVAGRTGAMSLSAGDPDGDRPHFRLVSGPAYATLRELVSHSGGASASLRITPGLCDVGTATALVAVSDGISEARRDVVLRVVVPTVLPDTLVHNTSNPGDGFGIKIVDMNGDGLGDAVVTYEGQARVSVLRGLGNGSFGPPTSYPIPSRAFRLAVGDLDGNGTPDVATADLLAGSVSVLLNRGDGTLAAAVSYPAGPSPQDVAIADVNRDGHMDLISASQASNSVSVLLGAGNGTFGSRRDSFAGPNPVFLAMADFDLDGRLDAVVGNQVGGNRIATFLPGLGDGGFGDAVPIGSTTRAFPLSVIADDWNLDGLPDLEINDDNNGALFLAGRGDGTFAAPAVVATMQFPFTSASGDLNGDGNPDLVVDDVGRLGVVVLLGNGAGGFSQAASFLDLTSNVTIGDLNADGRPDIATVGIADVAARFNRFGPANAAVARAFLPSDKRSVPLSGNSDLVVLVEPSDRSYTNDLVDRASFTLSSSGSGSVSLIHGSAAKGTIEADRDNNGVSEIGITFSRSDLAGLFNQIHGKQTVTADLAGSLTDGRAFCTDVTLNVIGKAQIIAAPAAFAPNPLNPQSKLTFATARDGQARVRIFDISGRLVRALLDTPRLAAGSHEIVFDGRTNRGATLSSGVYFYRVESIGGTSEGQIVILK